MTTLTEQMEADAYEAMKFTRKHFVVELDFSQASLAQLDEQCDAVDYTLAGGNSEENLTNLRRIWGAYLGETVRRLRDGRWEQDEDSTEPVLVVDGQKLYPHQRIYLRLSEGGQHALADF